MTSNHLIHVAIIVFIGLFCAFIGYCWGKARGHQLDGSPFGIWLGGAISAFIGGAVEGAPVGSSAGAGLAAVAGKLHADLTLRHVLVEILFLIAAPFGAGLADLRNFIKANPFPNVFLAAPPSPLVSGKPTAAGASSSP